MSMRCRAQVILWTLTLMASAMASAVANANSFAGLDLERILPIETPELKSGTAIAKKLPTRLPRPLFLLGTDRRSLAWLKVHYAKLRQLNAVGLIIDANSVPELKRIMLAAEGLLLVPASASDIARALDLTHYPVLLIDDRAVP